MKELNTLDQLFSTRIFRIPDYQRGFAWQKKQLIDFWEDILNLDDERFHYTGVITIKMVPKDKWQLWNDEKWLIESRGTLPCFVVDGQQRLTTISILLKCLSDIIFDTSTGNSKKEDEIYLESYSLKEINEKYISITQPPNHLVRAYKFGYETDNPSFKFLRHKIFGEPDSGTIKETFYTLNLENAYNFFKENLSILYRNQGEAGLKSVFNRVTQRLMFNIYEIEDEFDVFVAFETMNNRGKKLSDLELLKNRLIYLTTLYSSKEVPENEKVKTRNTINDAWAEVYYQLGRNKNHPLNDDEFLKAHWIMYFKYSRKKGDDYIRFLLDEQFNPKKVLEKVQVETNSMQDVLDLWEDEPGLEDDDLEEDEPIVQTKSKLSINEINKYVLSLQESAKHWYNTYNPLSDNGLANNEPILIDRLNRIGIGYFRPLIMSLFCTEEIDTTEREKVLIAIERFIFLAFRISRIQSNYKSSVYYGCARDLYKGEISTQDIIAWLNNDLKWTYEESGQFKTSYFKDFIYKQYKSNGTGYYGWNGLRYLLYEYEEALKIKRGTPKMTWKNFIKNEKDKVSIEHIYPQTANKQCWESEFDKFDGEQKKRLNGSLGNLLPLSLSINSSLQNDCFDSKKNVKTSEANKVIRNGYSNGSYSEQEIARVEKWTPDSILKRGLGLLEFLESRWNVELGDEKNKEDLLHLGFMREEPITETEA